MILKNILKQGSGLSEDPQGITAYADALLTKKGTDFSIPSALNQLNTKSLMLKPR